MEIVVLYFSCIVITLTLGLIAIFHNHKSRVHKLFFALIISCAIWMFSMLMGYVYVGPLERTLFFVRLGNASGFLIVLSLVLFFYYFPVVTKKINKIWIRSLIAFNLIFTAIALFTPYVQESIIIENGENIGDILGPLFPAFGLALLAQITLGFSIIIQKIRRTHGIDRQKILIAFSGFVLSIITVMITNILFPILEIYIFQKASIVFTLFMLGGAFYSMEKHRFFDLSLAILNTLRILILFILFLVVLLASHSLISWILPEDYHILILVISAGTAFIGIHYIEKLFPKLVSKSLKELKNNFKKVQSAIYDYDDYNKLLESIENTFIFGFGLRNTKIFIVRKNEEEISIPVYKRDKFIEIIQKKQLDSLIKNEIKYQKYSKDTKKVLTEALNHLDAAVCLPLYSETKLIGLFILGKKNNNEPFSSDELDAIIKFKEHIGVALMNILLKANLREENNLMRTIIDEKTQELQKRFEEIQHLLKQQSDFIAVTAHEFRTPLSIAKFQVEDIIESNSNDKLTKDMQVVESSLSEVVKLTQTLFDVQQYDYEKVSLNKERISLVEVIERIFKDNLDRLKQKEVELFFKKPADEKIFINIDAQKIRQLMQNIIDNAAKFAHEVTIDIVPQDEWVEVKVIDNGKGISDDAKKRIFEKFQTEKATLGTGIGLGLYLCKKIVELHNGEIRIEDTPGGGATFCIFLPT